MALPRTWSQGGDYYIPLRINLLTRMIEREMNRELQARYQLSVAEWRVLALTCTNGHASAADVAAAFEADPGQVSRAVAALLRTGLLERETLSGNRKKKALRPTDRGLEIFGVIHRKRQSYYRDILSALDPEELAAFDRALTAIATRVDALRGGSGEPDPPDRA
jgi:DNA-binding MarR family transcriptional regulator